MVNPGFFGPKRISGLILELSSVSDRNEKLVKIKCFLNELEEERGKIDGLKRELPLCVLLLDDAIVMLKKEAKQCVDKEEEEEKKPVLEEFIPMKRVDEEEEKEDKRNWLSSVQLWNCPEDPSTDQREELKTESKTERPIQVETTRTFLPFKAFDMLLGKEGSKREEFPVPALVTPGMIKRQREEYGSMNLMVPLPEVHLHSHLGAPILHQPGPPQKQRRCWSSELHSRFCKVLDQLGGCHVATPKQIRDLMQVDGLTNDEVKSHLQKYRLHSKRLQQPSSPTGSSQSTVFLSGLWKSQDGDSSRGASPQFWSPQCPFQLAAFTGTESTEDDDDDDDDIASEGFRLMNGSG